MKKLKSNLLNMVLSLTIITLVAAGLLGVVYMLTEEPISEAKLAKQNAAISSVLPQVEGLTVADAVEENGLVLHRAYVGDSLVGVAIETKSNGFGGEIRLMVGFDAECQIVGYEVLEHQETPGLGSHMVHWFKNTDKPAQSIIHRNPAETNLTVSKDGGDIDAITAATISSRAFLLAVENAYQTVQGKKVDAHSSATKRVDNENCDVQFIENEQDSVKRVNPDSHE